MITGGLGWIAVWLCVSYQGHETPGCPCNPKTITLVRHFSHVGGKAGCLGEKFEANAGMGCAQPSAGPSPWTDCCVLCSSITRCNHEYLPTLSCVRYVSTVHRRSL